MISKTELALQEAYDKLTPEEKFNKMLSMCKTVRTIITSNLSSEMNELEKRKKIFEIYYKSDFSEEDFNRICEMIFSKKNANNELTTKS